MDYECRHFIDDDGSTYMEEQDIITKRWPIRAGHCVTCHGELDKPMNPDTCSKCCIDDEVRR